MLDPGIVDDDVDLPEPRHGAVDHHVDGRAVRHVGAVIGDIDIVLFGEQYTLGLDLGRIAEAIQHHGGTGLGERPGDAEADAAGRSGDRWPCGLQQAAAGERRILCHGVEHCHLRWECRPSRRLVPNMPVACRTMKCRCAIEFIREWHWFSGCARAMMAPNA